MTRERQWAHNWVPLTLRAAILKAHGDRDEAERILTAARAGRTARRTARRARRADVVFSTPHPAHQADLARRRRLRAMTDDEIAAAMGTADEAGLAELETELGRRDTADRRRDARDAARQAEAERLVAAGEDEATAWRRAYGTTEEAERRQEVIARLRGDGHRGRNFDQLARSYHREEMRQSYLAAEGATRGHLLSPAGRAAGVDPRSLFEGSDARARKYASPELLAYWNANGRPTAADTRAELLGGVRRSRAASDVAG